MVVLLERAHLRLLARRRPALADHRGHHGGHRDRDQEGQQRRSAPADDARVDHHAPEVGEQVEQRGERRLRAAVRTVEEAGLRHAPPLPGVVGLQAVVVCGEKRVEVGPVERRAGVAARAAAAVARPRLEDARELIGCYVGGEKPERRRRGHAARQDAHHEAGERSPQEGQRHAERHVRDARRHRAPAEAAAHGSQHVRDV